MNSFCCPSGVGLISPNPVRPRSATRGTPPAGWTHFVAIACARLVAQAEGVAAYLLPAFTFVNLPEKDGRQP